MANYNTGRKISGTLTEIDPDTGLPTGNTKPNVYGDPDYIPPVLDLVSCSTTTTTSTNPEYVQLSIANNGTQALGFGNITVWYSTYPGGFYNLGLVSLPGSIKTVPQRLHLDDFIYIQGNGTSFSLGKDVQVDVYYTINFGAKVLKRTFVISQGIPFNEIKIPVPRNGAGSTDLIQIEFSDI